MNIVVYRAKPPAKDTTNSRTGLVEINRMPWAYSMELPWRNNHHETSCIPAGTYDVVIRWSNDWKRLMPHIENVPDRDGILIHYGNKPANYKGCVGVGYQLGPMDDWIGDTKAAFDKLFGLLNEGGENTITLVDPPIAEAASGS